MSLFILKEVSSRQGRNLEAGADTGAGGGGGLGGGACCLLISHGLLSLFSYRTQSHQPRDGTTHNGLGPTLIDL